MVPRTNQITRKLRAKRTPDQRFERIQLELLKCEKLIYLSGRYLRYVEGNYKGFTSLKTVGRDRLLVRLVIRHFFVFSFRRMGKLSMRITATHVACHTYDHGLLFKNLHTMFNNNLASGYLRLLLYYCNHVKFIFNPFSSASSL